MPHISHLAFHEPPNLPPISEIAPQDSPNQPKTTHSDPPVTKIGQKLAYFVRFQKRSPQASRPPPQANILKIGQNRGDFVWKRYEVRPAAAHGRRYAGLRSGTNRITEQTATERNERNRNRKRNGRNRKRNELLSKPGTERSG